MKIKNILLTLCTSLLLTNVAAHAKEVKIGMAIDDLRLERWQKDRDIFVKKAESLGAKVFVQSAGNDSNLLIVFYVQIMPDDFVMQLHRF